VQFDSISFRVESASEYGFSAMKQKYHKQVSAFVINFNLRCYMKASGTVDMHRLYDFQSSLMHHFFEATARQNMKGVTAEARDALGGDECTRMHTGAVELAGKFKGVEVTFRSSGDGALRARRE